MPDELTKALLLEEVASEAAIADALFASVTAGIPLVQALSEAGAVTPDVLARYLARTEAPYLRQVVPVAELVDRLPPGLCARLLAIPVRRDAITGTIDVVVPDAGDGHAASEIAFHLGAPVRLVRATTAAIEEALRRMRSRSFPPSRPPASGRGSRASSRPPASRSPGSRPPGSPSTPDDERMYDSRPRAAALPPSFKGGTLPPPGAPFGSPGSFKGGTLPPPAPAMKFASPAQAAFDALTSEALRPSRLPGAERQGHAVPAATPPHGLGHGQRKTRDTPPWGTPVHNAQSTVGSEHPASGLGSEIPIPLTRRTFAAVSGGTQRPPPLVDPAESALGEGYPVDAAHFRQIVEVNERMRPPADFPMAEAPWPLAMPSFIPGPPPLPGGGGGGGGGGSFAAYAPQIPFADIGGILSALRAAGARDEVLELVLTGGRMVALKVALFVVKRGGYLGWACTPEFGERAALQSVLVPLERESVFDEAVRDGLYLGPVRHDEVHAPLLHVMRGASRDVAVVPIRVSGKTAVIVMADELGDTMLATRRLEELARAAGDAFARIVRMRR